MNKIFFFCLALSSEILSIYMSFEIGNVPIHKLLEMCLVLHTSPCGWKTKANYLLRESCLHHLTELIIKHIVLKNAKEPKPKFSYSEYVVCSTDVGGN